MAFGSLISNKSNQNSYDHNEMVKSIVKSCMNSTCVVLSCIIVFELFFYINSWIHPKGFRDLIIWYRACYLSLLIASIIGLILVIYSRRDYDRRYSIIEWMSPIYSTIITVWALAVAYLDCLKTQTCSAIIIMTIMLCIPACIYVNPKFFITLNIIANILMLCILIWAPGGGKTPIILNYAVFMIIQPIVSGFFLTTKYNYYKTTQEVVKNEQNARKAVEAKANTLSNMSHELRTPLNAILGMTELIRRKDSDNQMTEYTDNIVLAGDSLLALVNDMLDFSKLEAGKMRVIVSSYSLSKILSNVFGIMNVLARNKGLDFKITVDKGTPNDMVGDAQRIQQLIINLVNNAIKYTRVGGVELRIHMEKADISLLCVEVIDTGIGIKQEDIPYLFDSFSQVDEEANHHIEGTGLGLMICERFVKLMDGEIGVKSVYGEGSNFWFKIPQKVEKENEVISGNWNTQNITYEIPVPEKMENNSPVKSKESKDKASKKKARVLVVDDSPMNLKVFVKFLENEPLIIDTADSGMSCLEMIKNNKYDMIFLDHLMPEMSGIETLAKIRESSDDWCKEVKIIALTANGGEHARDEYIGYGFNDYLSKPIHINELLSMVESL